jgi:hypothetical protein
LENGPRNEIARAICFAKDERGEKDLTLRKRRGDAEDAEKRGRRS